MSFSPGQKVVYRSVPPGGYGFAELIPGTVIRVNPKTVRIEVDLIRGGSRQINVKPQNLRDANDLKQGK